MKEAVKCGKNKGWATTRKQLVGMSYPEKYFETCIKNSLSVEEQKEVENINDDDNKDDDKKDENKNEKKKEKTEENKEGNKDEPKNNDVDQPIINQVPINVNNNNNEKDNKEKKEESKNVRQTDDDLDNNRKNLPNREGIIFRDMIIMEKIELKIMKMIEMVM